MPEIVRQNRIRLPGGPTGATTPFENLIWRDTALSPALGQSLWESCPYLAIEADRLVGTGYTEDFTNQTIASNTIGGWVYTSVTSGSITLSTTAANGVALISAGAVTANQGSNWIMAQPSWTVGTTKRFWAETYLQFTGLSTTPKVQFAWGLAAAGTNALITAGAVDTTKDFIGFAGVSTTGVILSNTQASSTATTGAGFTIADSTFYRLGIAASPTSVSFYVNGLVVNTITTNIPAGALAPIYTVQGNGTVTCVANVDYLRVIGIR